LTTPYFATPFGLAPDDFPTPGDYDGDGKTDISVWRPNADPDQNYFYFFRSSDFNVGVYEFGSFFDYPTANSQVN
jgi:hypothetical protein